jgi:hypothetical protein
MQKKTKLIAGLSKMAKEHGIDDGTVRNRISRGWDLETALKTPLKYTKKKT